ncbi:group II intron reverse transcriptase/maturase [Zobellia sp.]|nr:group II intron reverse transcriptase/maturase [Zobellia sp.]
MSEYDLQRQRHLYKVWNRLASGSYFPPPVLQVEIPKKNGSVRQLGIPTIRDRVAQTVIKNQIEERLEKIFHPQSYGYRPKRSAHQALEQVRKNCWKYDWVIDLNIKNFFDDIDHEKLLKALGKHVEEKWVLGCFERWLKAPLKTQKGKFIARTNGTPQGGVISLLLANLFLHYTLDVWLGRSSLSIEFVCYADDIIIHCWTQSQAEQSLQQIKGRMGNCGLTLHPDKTKIVYFKDFRRQQKYQRVQFDFLGYTFQPRTSKSKKTGRLFLGFDCAISIQSRSRLFSRSGKWKSQECDATVLLALHIT